MTQAATVLPFLRATDDGVSLAVQVQPGAKRGEIAGLHGERLKLRVKAPPLDGRANEAVIDLLSELLGLPASAISIQQGAQSRAKLVRLRGLSLAELTPRLQALLPGNQARG